MNIICIMSVCTYAISLFRETTKTTKAEVGKKTTRRSKERVQFVTDPQARPSALYKRKSTLFSKGLSLHAMTNAEVLIMIDHNGQRFVGGSQAILNMYNSLIKPTGTDQEYAEDAVSTSTETVTDLKQLFGLRKQKW